MGGITSGGHQGSRPTGEATAGNDREGHIHSAPSFKKTHCSLRVAGDDNEGVKQMF